MAGFFREPRPIVNVVNFVAAILGIGTFVLTYVFGIVDSAIAPAAGALIGGLLGFLIYYSLRTRITGWSKSAIGFCVIMTAAIGGLIFVFYVLLMIASDAGSAQLSTWTIRLHSLKVRLDEYWALFMGLVLAAMWFFGMCTICCYYSWVTRVAPAPEGAARADPAQAGPAPKGPDAAA